MKAIELLLTRHGETLENQRHVLQGQLPGVLSPIGRRQAEELAMALEGEALDAIVCSDLARSRDTAQAVADVRGIVPCATHLLREMDWGVYTGGALVDVDWDNLPPSVESVEALYSRAGAFVDFLRAHYAGQRVLAVGHGAVNRAIVTYVRGGAPREMNDLPIMENTSVVRLTIG